MSQVGVNYGTNIIGPNQPPVAFWNVFTDGINGGTRMTLPPGTYNLATDQAIERQYGPIIGINDIDSIWVPPNLHVHADQCYSSAACKLGEVTAEYDGNETNTGFPGLYWPLTDAVGINNIDTVKITVKDDQDETDSTKTVPYTWRRHLQKCCLGLADSRVCGQYNPTSSMCATAFDTCTGIDLKNSSLTKPTYQAQYCRKLCKSDLSNCDSIKTNYCSANPTDPWCSCMLLSQSDDYHKWMTLLAQQYPGVVASPLAFSNNGVNSCRDAVGGDLNTIFIPSQFINVPLPTSYDLKNLTVTGDGNVVSGTIGGDNTGNTVNNNTGDAAFTLFGMTLKTIIYIVVCILAVILSVILWPSSNKKRH